MTLEEYIKPFTYTLTSMAPVEVCATCKRVVKTDAQLLFPAYFYGETVSIRYKPEEYCQCVKELPSENQSEDNEDERASWDFYEYSDGYPDSIDNDDGEE